VKRLRFGAVLLALVLALGWASAAQATGTTTGDQTTPTVQTPPTEPTEPTEPTQPTEPTEPGGDEKPCSATEGLVSHSAISVDKSSNHPSASASFTVKEGCQVVVLLFSGKGNGDANTELFDLAPEGDPLAGPGDHTLTVDLPNCSQFIVDFVAFSPADIPAGAQTLSGARMDAVRVMAEGDEPPPDDFLLDEVVDKTTNCPTQTTNGEVRPTTTVATTVAPGGQLPFTGTNAMPILIAGLVLVAGGAAAVIASRMRGRQQVK
jgi:hypothetical protein